MEININCDLGEKSKLHNNENDKFLLEIVNSANVACGYHAGDEDTMQQVIEISKKNNVSIGAHPSFNDPDNFGRTRISLPSSEIRKLIIDQYEILQRIAVSLSSNVTHIKPHGPFHTYLLTPRDAMIIGQLNQIMLALHPEDETVKAQHEWFETWLASLPSLEVFERMVMELDARLGVPVPEFSFLPEGAVEEVRNAAKAHMSEEEGA